MNFPSTGTGSDGKQPWNDQSQVSICWLLLYGYAAEPNGSFLQANVYGISFGWAHCIVEDIGIMILTQLGIQSHAIICGYPTIKPALAYMNVLKRNNSPKYHRVAEYQIPICHAVRLAGVDRHVR